ncbi:hypothetical protein GCM10008110_02740 [Marinobacter persicus]|nr:hypothetical protein GCM10008110_02740 [Marinobacter persicus]
MIDSDNSYVTAKAFDQGGNESMSVIKPGQLKKGGLREQLQATARIRNPIMQKDIANTVSQARLDAFPGGVFAIDTVAGDTEICGLCL